MMLGYTRVSTLEQAAENRSSLAEQERVIKGLAMTRGVGTYDLSIFSDPGISGATPLQDRPAGKRLLETASRNDVIVAAKLDRMFRSASDALLTAERLKAQGIDLILFNLGADPVTGNGMAKCFFTMASAFAELERTTIAERVAQGKAAKAAKGGSIGGSPPYGFRVVGQGRDARFEPDPEEQDVISLIRYTSTRHGYHMPSRTAKALNRMGVTNRAGGEFKTTQVIRILERCNNEAALYLS